MKKIKQSEGDRSGYLSDMKRVDAAVKRWQRDLPYIKRAAFGRYAPNFCFGQPGIHVDIRNFHGSKDEFYTLVETALLKRFYQPATRRKYLSCLKRFLNWLTVPTSRVTDKCIYAYFAEFKNRKIKPGTFSLHFCALRTIFDCFCHLEITVDGGKKALVTRHEALGLGEDGREREVDGIEEGHINTELQREEIEAILSVRHSARNLAMLCGLLLLDVKVNEMLNIRRKDVLLKEKKIVVWAGLGRREREVELPEALTSFFIYRMNELDDGDYLFSSIREPGKALSGKGANLIIKRIFERAGIKKRISCRGILKSMISSDVIFEGYRNELPEVKAADKIVVRDVGILNLKIGSLTKRKYIVSADAELLIKADKRETLKLTGIHITDFGYKGVSVRYPVKSKWDQELLWAPREVRERLSGGEFRKKIEKRIILDYLAKKQICYIGREKINAYWAKMG